MMRYGLKTGNWFLLLKDEVTHILYIQYARLFGPFFWLIAVRMIWRVEVAQKFLPLPVG